MDRSSKVPLVRRYAIVSSGGWDFVGTSRSSCGPGCALVFYSAVWELRSGTVLDCGLTGNCKQATAVPLGSPALFCLLLAAVWMIVPALFLRSSFSGHGWKVGEFTREISDRPAGEGPSSSRCGGPGSSAGSLPPRQYRCRIPGTRWGWSFDLLVLSSGVAVSPGRRGRPGRRPCC